MHFAKRWLLPSRMKLKLFLTAWVLCSLHWATDFVREHYLVLSIVESRSFDLSPYLGFHEDIFRNPDRSSVAGVHHGGNPGISMLAAVPYALFRPAVDMAAGRAAARISGAAIDPTAEYRDERRARVWFYQMVRAKGLDVKFGLVAAVTMVFCMAPLTAWSVVIVFSLLRRLRLGEPLALGLSLLYLVGTPLLFRTGFLNQNTAIAVVSIAAFALLWPAAGQREPRRWQTLAAGALAGFGFLCDYSGAVGLAVLGLYSLAIGWSANRRIGDAVRMGSWFTAGALPMIALLWLYQWQSFGHPFYPPQHWMPNQNQFVSAGYQGVSGPSADIAALLLFEPRYGLFIAAPLTLLALLAPVLAWRGRALLPRRELAVCLLLPAAYLAFFSSVQYVHLQWNTGFRYLMPAIPFLFLAAVPALLQLPKIIAALFALAGVTVGLSIAMVRSQLGIADNVLHILAEGPQLPWLTTLAKMSRQYMPWLEGRPSATAAFLLAGLIIWWIWKVRSPWRPVLAQHE